MRTSAPEPDPPPDPPPPRLDPGPPLREEYELPDGRYLLAYWRRLRPEPAQEQDRERA